MSADLHVQMYPRRRGVKKGTASPKKGAGLFSGAIFFRCSPEMSDHLSACARANESIDEHGVIVAVAPAVKSDASPRGHSWD